MKRVLIDNPTLLFKEILEKKDFSLKKLSQKVKVSYSNLKKWKSGARSIPYSIFILLLKYSKNRRRWLKRTVILSANWGQSKGGKISSSKKGLSKRMAHIRKCRKQLVINIKLNKAFCEFYGALLGDGCLSRYFRKDGFQNYEVVFAGDGKNDLLYHSYLKKLIKKEFGLQAYSYKYKKRNFIKTMIKNKQFFKKINSFGFPAGKKGNKIIIPKRILTLPWKIKKLVLRGLFDTDGSIFAKKNEDYRYPYICITLRSPLLMKQIHNILRKEGYPAYLNNDNLFVKGIKNVQRWMADIGTSNPKHKFKYNYWLENKVLPAHLKSGPVV